MHRTSFWIQVGKHNFSFPLTRYLFFRRVHRPRSDVQSIWGKHFRIEPRSLRLRKQLGSARISSCARAHNLLTSLLTTFENYNKHSFDPLRPHARAHRLVFFPLLFSPWSCGCWWLLLVLCGGCSCVLKVIVAI